MKTGFKIVYTPTFAKNFRKLPLSIKKKAELKLPFFKTDPFHLKLKTHKLAGKLNNYWSFSIDLHYRIVFRFVEKIGILFVDVGTHSAYR